MFFENNRHYQNRGFKRFLGFCVQQDTKAQKWLLTDKNLGKVAKFPKSISTCFCSKIGNFKVC